MSNKSVIVVGAGIAGIATAAHAAANGYDTRVYEMHTLPGGLCTSWEQRDYTFDGCIHWLVGANPTSSMRRLWDEVGALDGTSTVDHDEYLRVRSESGQEVVIWADLDRLEGELLAVSPSDSAPIRELIRSARTMLKYAQSVPDSPPDQMGLLDGLKAVIQMGPAMRTMRRLSTTSLGEFSERFCDPFLRRVFNLIVGEPRFSLLLASTLAWFHAKDAVWPIGGSLPFAKNMERRARDLGAAFTYGARVERILVEGDRAVGVRLADGTEDRADFVISAADGHSTIFGMLEGRYADNKVRSLYDELEPFTAIFQLSLGVLCDLSDQPRAVRLLLDTPVEVGGLALNSIEAHHYCYDPSMAPPGGSVVVAIATADFEHWQRLREDGRDAYRAAKHAAARQLTELVERIYPDVRDNIEVVDLATPATYVRYTGNWQGSFEGWLLSPKNARIAGLAGLPRKLPGLSGFYMAGQWVMPGGGLPTAVMTARWAIQSLCREDGRTYTPPLAPT